MQTSYLTQILVYSQVFVDHCIVFECSVLNIQSVKSEDGVVIPQFCLGILNFHASNFIYFLIRIKFRFYRQAGWIYFQMRVKWAGEKFRDRVCSCQFYWSMICVVQLGVLVLFSIMFEFIFWLVWAFSTEHFFLLSVCFAEVYFV